MPKPPTRDQISHAFAQTVRSLRLKAGISQERLARSLGVDRANTAALERGRRTPTLYTVCRLLPGLRVTFAEFARELERNLNREVNRRTAIRPPAALGVPRKKKAVTGRERDPDGPTGSCLREPPVQGGL
jgi:transcriptional regulator with XRE-family HTH domain